MRKSKNERIAELKKLLNVEDDSPEDLRIKDLTEEEVIGELFLAKKIHTKRDDEEGGIVFECSMM